MTRSVILILVSLITVPSVVRYLSPCIYVVFLATKCPIGESNFYDDVKEIYWWNALKFFVKVSVRYLSGKLENSVIVHQILPEPLAYIYMDLRNVSCLISTGGHCWERGGSRQKPEPLDI